VSASLIAIVAIGGFQALIYILNLNQIGIFLQVAFWIWIYLWFKISLLYDLHFKNPGALARAKARHESIPHWLKRSFRIWITALWNRFEHIFKWKNLRQCLNYLLLPGFVFWATTAIFYVNLGQIQIQQIYAWLSTVALVVAFWYLKEAFSRRKEVVDKDIFVALSVVKIYAVAVSYAATMAIMRRFCLEPWLFSLGIFSLTFLFIYQALFQHKKININTMLVTMVIAGVLATLGYFVYINWGFNYLTAAIFMTAFYNLFWGAYHYHLDRALTKKAFLEILLICLLIAYLVLTNTNFKAKILDGCVF
jgi:hypothetical protein